MKKSHQSSERKLWRQRRIPGIGSRAGEPGRGCQEFSFHLNRYAENALATFSQDVFVAKSNGSFSFLNKPSLLLQALSARATLLVSPG